MSTASSKAPTAHLPVAMTPWFHTQDMGDGLTLIVEPYVDVLEQANIWHLKGRDRDLLIDSGMGILSLRDSLPGLFEGRETIALATHTHLDHIGSLHEFEHRWVHPIEADRLEQPKGSLVSEDMDAELRRLFVAAGYPPLSSYLIHALPYKGYRPEDYVLKPAPATRLIREGEIVDLGDRQFEVLFVPGHSPGSIALFERATGILFAGDIVYDGPLLYQGFGMSVEDYVRSFDLLRSLPITIVHAGHDPSFDKARLDEIIDAYMARWREEGLI